MRIKLVLLFGLFVLLSILWVPAFIVTIPLFILGFYDGYVQKSHSLRSNYPVISRLRWLFESERDKIRQYFNESNLDGTPVNRESRSIVFQRSKGETETIPFGTEHNVYEPGYEFVHHSMYTIPEEEVKIHIDIGGEVCRKPITVPVLGISAMSHGSLSGAAVRALNKGAGEGSFLHNTGEGGISEEHCHGGKLMFQIGTGYFGAGFTDDQGVRRFHRDTYSQNAIRTNVSAIELKISQGAKPGHGGILPGKKNTPEIAANRGITPWKTYQSPPSHSEFSTPSELVRFISFLRQDSNWKPIGIKLCVGNKEEIIDMIKMFKETETYPDFITVDGGEGGTGSAPLEFTNYVGLPLYEGLDFIVKTLHDYDLYGEIKVLASGGVRNAFDIVKLLALGAHGTQAARAFMFSLGCIQARECNLDTCPTGVATQSKSLQRALHVESKAHRVAMYHEKTMKALRELIGAMGYSSISDIKRSDVFRRCEDGQIRSFEDIYGSINN